jgi:hypothetical protein
MARNLNQHNEAKRLHYYTPGLGDGSVHVQNQQQQQGLRGRKRTRAEQDNGHITPSFRKSLDRASSNNNGFLSGDTAADTSLHHSREGQDHYTARHPQNINNEYIIKSGESITNPIDDTDIFDASSNNNRRTSTDNYLQDNTPNHGLRIGNTMTVTSDGTWQLSVLILFAIIGLLIALFIHFITTTDPSSQSNTLFRSRRIKKGPFKSPNYRKKTDEWSDDADVEEDYDYPLDSTAEEGVVASATELLSSGNNTNYAKKRIPPSPIPPNDPMAHLYHTIYKDGNNFRQQESRLRKSATSQQQQPFQTPSRMSATHPYSPSVVSSSNNRNVGNRSFQLRTAMANSSSGYEQSPGVGMRSPTIDPFPRIDNTTSMLPCPPYLDSGVGSGLEGFEHSVAMNKRTDDREDRIINNETNHESISSNSWAGSFETEAIDDDEEPTMTGHARVKPMGTFTPTDSFVAMPSMMDSEEDKHDSFNSNVVFHTPPLTDETAFEEYNNTMPPSSSTDYIPSFTTPEKELLSPRRLSRGISSDIMDFPTPRVENSTTKREIDKQIVEAHSQMAGFALPFDEVDNSQTDDGSDDPLRFLRDLQGVPVVPNLNASPQSGDTQRSIDAPRSVLLEELHLIRMESGVQGPRWVSEMEAPPKGTTARPFISSAPSTGSPSKHGGQNYMHPMFGLEESAWCEPVSPEVLEQRRQVSENEAKLREASSVMDPECDPRNGIQHVRNDLTEASDTSSSLSSKILFSELKLLEVIGGGGFGQVWSAKWKGTPVAVKVLTGAAQAETVPKAVIEEFIAEINMVSGMRHPNICLFMGACLDPPNRAIVTELCENGSLWDALRNPLLPPYQPADGMTRSAWPLELYDTLNRPPTTPKRTRQDTGNPPMAPAGSWPWILVKRVASGTARGMCYLHSGNPPVLHRDLKSANILLDESYTAKLADFGLSRLKAVRSGMTGNCGTVQWMAPEVLCNEDYAEPADVFSYGIILWEMLTRECPYEGMTPIQCALSVLNENNRPKIPEWCPQSFRALIKNCVERNPKDRPTFNQILAALDSLP